MWTVSASIWRSPWVGKNTATIAGAAFLTRSVRTQPYRGSKSSPNPGISAPVATSSVASRPAPPNGTTASVIPHADSGAAMTACCRDWPPTCWHPATCSITTAGGLGPRSITSPATMASPWPTWSATTNATTRPTAKTTAMAILRISATTRASKDPPTTRPSGSCACACAATCWPPCYWLRARPCCWPATNPGVPRTATTTPTARTTRSTG